MNSQTKIKKKYESYYAMERGYATGEDLEIFLKYKQSKKGLNHKGVYLNLIVLSLTNKNHNKLGKKIIYFRR